MNQHAASIALGLLLAVAPTAPAAEKPSVLLICVDDLKPLLGCYGAPTVHSPSIDRLATRGVLFERAFCNQAVCAPSRNSLMTGLRPQTIGVYDLGTNFRKAVPDAVTLAQYFQRRGYRTEAMGKIMHVGHGNHEDPASWSVPHWGPKAGPAGGYVLKENRPPQLTREEGLFMNLPWSEAAKLPRGAPTESADVPDSTYADGRIADEAIRRLRAAKNKPSEPFFLAVGFLKPHLPFVAPKKYWDLYDPAALPLPTLKIPPLGAPSFAPTTWGELRQYSDIPATGPLDDAKARHLIHGYHAAVSYMDAQLGRVLDELDRLDLAKNTIIVLWGDHGWHLGDHGMWCKHTNYEQAAKIPLIVSAPGTAKAGVKTGALAETVDIYPTLCELAGLPAPPGLDGASFVAALKDPAAAAKAAVFHVYPRAQTIGRAVRTARHRLVEWKKPGAPADTAVLELYDYQSDPAETKNLAAEQPAIVAKLRAMLARQPEAKPQVSAGKKPAAKRAGAKSAVAKPRQDHAAMFAQRDKNGDGKLTREEFPANQRDPDQAPNVLFILADDLGWRDLGCTTSTFYHTPAIDRLASQGMRFTQAYAACNVCSPTRASVMTGKYPARLHTTNFFGGNRRGKLLPPDYRQYLPPGEVTFAAALRQHGYRTAIAGKWHLGGKGSLPQDHGFEVVLGQECRPGGGPPDDPHFARMLSTKAAEFIEQSRDRPFFCYLALHSVHVPLKTRPELRRDYQAKAEALPPTGPREVPVGDHKARAVQDHAVYAGMVQEMDEAVDRVLRKLDELKLTDRTVVVFTSDNGGLCTAEGSPTSNLPLRAGKGWNYEGGLRVPLAVRLPGRIKAGSTCDAPVISNDFYPTLLALAGLPLPKTHQPDGVSLLPLLQQQGKIADRPLFWHYPHYSNQGGRPGGAVRLGNYKLIESFEDGRLELYDLAADPGESQDLSGHQPQRTAEMQKLLADWRRQVGAQMPTPNPEPVEPFGPRGVPPGPKPKRKSA